MGGLWHRYLKPFGLAFASLVAVAAAFWTAVDLGRELEFFVVAALAALGVAAWGIAPRARPWIDAIRNHGRVLDLLEQCQHELTTVRAAARLADENLAAAYDQGIEEGTDRVIASLMNPPGLEVPELVSRWLGDEGDLWLTASYGVDSTTFEPGTRFWLCVNGTGTIRGTVAVVDSDADQRTVALRCVERTDGEYWDALEASAIGDASPPGGVHLRRYSVVSDEDVADIRRALAHEPGEELGT